MAKAVVLLFLLDSLPGMIGVCDSTITPPVLQVIGKKLNLTEDSVEKLQHIDLPMLSNHRPSHKFQELSPETLNNVGFNDNSIQESYEFSIEKRPNFIERVYKDNATTNEDILQSVLKTNAENGGKIEYPESAPFLAAIFETVGNVTAQTCGGVVLSARWVLTAASCVNVLGPFYSNSSHKASDNYYSVVVGAKDPLKDGTVHQVSKIYLHPSNSNKSVDLPKDWFDSVVSSGNTAPILALLRVEPAMQGMLQMVNSTAWDGVTAIIYSWVLEQNQTGFQMRATSSPAKQLTPAHCKITYGIVVNNSTLCLTVDESLKNTRMTAGCPVVVIQHGRPALLAVAVTDGTQLLLASPLSAHRDWLNRVTRDTGK